jgi:hypothetical protein
VARVRDLALAAQPYLPQLAPEARTRADAAIRSAVRASWLLHVSADEGYPYQTRMAAAIFRDAVGELVGSFAKPPR